VASKILVGRGTLLAVSINAAFGFCTLAAGSEVTSLEKPVIIDIFITFIYFIKKSMFNYFSIINIKIIVLKLFLLQQAARLVNNYFNSKKKVRPHGKMDLNGREWTEMNAASRKKVN
jgi:hypothetical protein